MKLIILIAGIMLASFLVSNAQVSSYTFSQTTTTITWLSSGYTEHTTGTTDYGVYNDIPLGFTFNYNGTNYTSVSICNDGFIAMGSSVSSTYYPLSTGTSNNVIAGLANDLQGLSTATLRSQMLGTAPNRTFVVEWRHYEKYSGTDDYSFQIILYETSNKIDVKYTAATTVADNTFQVGLRGSSNTDYNIRTKASTVAWTSSTAATANTDVMTTGGNAARNPNGIFTWTPVNMSYTSSAVTQANTTPVAPGETNREIIGIQIVTTGTNNPINVSSFTFNTTGTTNATGDIQNARLWFTDGNSTFATTTQIGSVVAAPNGVFTISGFTQNLVGGTNYFWLTYDIKSGATINNVVDATCTSLTVGSARTPSPTTVAGTRQILNMTTIGTGTSTQTYPFYTNYGYTRSASLYTSSELGSAGNITHLGWYIATAQTASIPVKIYLKRTSSSVLTSQTWADLIAGATLVYDATVSFTPVGWKTFDITDFTICNDNLVVLCEANYGGTGAGSTVYFNYTTVASNMHEYFSADNSAPTGTGTLSSSRPNIQITKVAPTNCSGTPTAGTVSVTPSSVTNCSTPVVLSSTGYSNTCGINYQWQWSSDNITWSNIPGATYIPFSTTPIGNMTYYRLVVTCTNSGVSATSGAVSVTGTTSVSGSYSFTSTTGTYSSISGTTIHAAGVDDVCVSGIPIGFTFNYGCQPYTTVSVSSNGWLSFNSTTSSNASNDLTGYSNVLAPLWDDLETASSTGIVRYTTTGSSPNRVFTVEWYNMLWNYSATGAVLDFQVKLYESNGRIDFIYNQEGTAINSGSASIGISGGTVGSYYSLSDASNSPTVSSLTETNTIASKPNNNRVYRWDPVTCSGTPSGGTVTATPSTGACINSPVTLNASGFTSSCNMTFTWQSSLDNSTWGDMLGCNFSIPTTVTPTVSPTYYRLKATCGSSGLSGYSNVLPVSIVGAPSNDLPCNATPLAMGGVESGDNNCASGTGEPAAASCWTNGSINTVWYSVVAPASGSIKFRTTLGTLSNTQIALYSGTCGSTMTMVTSACNDDQATCGTSSYYNSDMTVAGLTPGVSYYLAVDGYNSLTGTFTVMAIDGASGWPGMPGQDCGLQIPVCSSNFTVGDPGYQAVGAICDFSSTNICLLSGERGTVWYSIPITTTGTLMFVITPNDLGSTAGDETDYDFAIWKTTGTAPVATCASILAGDVAIPPVACNYSFLGVTGCYTGGNYTLGTMNFDAAFETPISVTAGEVYTLVISNFSNSTSGFNINLSGGSATIGYPVPGTITSLTWTGGAGNTDWFNPLNWGNCNTEIPSPTIDAIIPPSSANMPIINAAGAKCKSLSVSSGALCGINSGYSLEVYGNITNYGTLSFNDNSTVQMSGTANQYLEGSFTGTSSFGNFTVNKTAASTVTFNQDVAVDGTLTTSNSNSDINANGKLVMVGGNIVLANSSYTPGTNGEMRLVNNNAQNITTNNNSMFNFTMMKSGNSATLLTDVTVTSQLNLTQGVINTGTYKMICTSTNATDIFNHNMLSYINGNLRKYIANNTSTYAFPMGTATAYRLAELVNNNLVGITYLDVKFVTPFTNTGTINSAICQDFGTPYTVICPEGIWQIDPNVVPSSGNYNIKLWFDGGGANAFAGLIDNSFAPVKRSSASTLASDWSATPGVLNANNGLGRLVSNGYALRKTITSFSQHAIARTNSPLPVELIFFTANCNTVDIELQWSTASEVNASYFKIRRSADGINFEDVSVVPASGNSVTQRYYKLIVEKNEIDYVYQLMQFDFDGTPYILGTVSSNCFETQSNLFNAYFAELSGNIVVSNTFNKSGSYSLDLYDATGRLVYSENVNIENVGRNELILPAKQLSSGIYTVNLRGGSESLSAKVEVR